jgi:glutaminase
VRSDLFGICVVGTNGEAYEIGDTAHEFTIMSVSKPFIFALVAQALGVQEVRDKIGANAIGMAFNSVAALERSADARTNPMVNSGAIATTSLVPGSDVATRWKFIYDGLCSFAGRALVLDEETLESARATNHRNQGIARVLQSASRIRLRFRGLPRPLSFSAGVDLTDLIGPERAPFSSYPRKRSLISLWPPRPERSVSGRAGSSRPLL